MKKVENNKRGTLMESSGKNAFIHRWRLHALELHIPVQWLQAEKQNKPIKHTFQKRNVVVITEILWSTSLLTPWRRKGRRKGQRQATKCKLTGIRTVNTEVLEQMLQYQQDKLSVLYHSPTYSNGKKTTN